MIPFIDLRKHLWAYVRVARGLAADPHVPWLPKMLIGAATGYFLLPIDLIPDFIPVVGHLDDAIVIPALLYLAVRLIPREVLREHLAAMCLKTRVQRRAESA